MRYQKEIFIGDLILTNYCIGVVMTELFGNNNRFNMLVIKEINPREWKYLDAKNDTSKILIYGVQLNEVKEVWSKSHAESTRSRKNK